VICIAAAVLPVTSTVTTSLRAAIFFGRLFKKSKSFFRQLVDHSTEYRSWIILSAMASIGRLDNWPTRQFIDCQLVDPDKWSTIQLNINIELLYKHLPQMVDWIIGRHVNSSTVNLSTLSNGQPFNWISISNYFINIGPGLTYPKLHST
jgi:hypothetical protein